MLHDLLFKHHKNLSIRICDDLLNSPKYVKAQGKIVAWADILGKVRNFYFPISPQAPGAQKIADEVVFRHFQGEGVEFF